MSVLYARSYDGQIVAVMTDPLTAFYARTWTWRTTRDGYVHRKTSRREDGRTVGVNIYLHRLVTLAPEGFDVDHINGDPYDNRPENLRITTPSFNRARNQWVPKGRPYEDETTPREGSIVGQEVRSGMAQGEAPQTVVG